MEDVVNGTCDRLRIVTYVDAGAVNREGLLRNDHDHYWDELFRYWWEP